MPRKRRKEAHRGEETTHTPDQVVRKLREADRLLADGKDVSEVSKHLEVSEQTYQRWRKQYGGLKADDSKRLKELAKENTRLKRWSSPGLVDT